MKKDDSLLTTTSSSPDIEANGDDDVEAAPASVPTAQNLEEIAVQNATQHSIRATHGAYAVAPANNTVTSRRISSNGPSTSSNNNSSSGATAAVNNNASTPSRSRRSNNTALESSDYHSSNYGDGSVLPPNIDIIAVATLVPNPSDEQETTTHQLETTDVTVASDEADTLGLNINEEPPRGGARDGLSVVSEITTQTAIAPPLETLELHTMPTNFNNSNTASASVTTANCELAQVNNNATSCNGEESGGGETGSSVNPSTSINTPTPDAQLPVATAEPMGQTSAVIIGDKYIQIKWWHFVIVVLIILVIVLPSTLIPLQRKKGVDLLNTWINNTDNLQETIEQILIENYISNPSTFNNTSSPQYQALNWMANEGGATTIIASNVEQATPYIIQRYILAVLYYITNGPKWRNQYDFLSNVTECEWGVGANNGFNVIDCNNDGFVTLINLWQNNLMGVIPTELVNMTNCTGLDFLTNRLYGSVPVEITQMVQMTYLNLGYNDFTGTVMSEYGNMNRLTYLMMDFNNLVGTIPPELGKLTQLTGWLSLEGNSLTGTIPESFAGFTNATWIYLNQNKLTGSAEFLCDALNPIEKYGYTDLNSTSPLLELWVDREEVNCTCCNCCPFPKKERE